MEELPEQFREKTERDFYRKRIADLEHQLEEAEKMNRLIADKYNSLFLEARMMNDFLKTISNHPDLAKEVSDLFTKLYQVH